MGAKAGTPEFGQGGRHIVRVAGRAFVIQGQQYDYLYTGAGQAGSPFVQLLDVASYIEIADQDQPRVFGLANEVLAVGQGPGDVRPAAQLRAKEELQRVIVRVR